MSWIRQALESIWNAASGLIAGRTWAVIVGILCAVFAVALIVTSRRRLGQTKPITVAIVLSILAHIWLLIYASGIRDRLPPGSPRGSQQAVAMAFSPMDDAAEASETADEQATESALDVAPSPPAPWERPMSLDQFPLPVDVARLLNEQPVAPEVQPLLEPAPMPPLPELLPQVAEAPVEQLSDSSAEPGIGDVLPPELADSIEQEQFVEPEVMAQTEPVLPELARFNVDPSQMENPVYSAQPLDVELVRNDRSPVLPPTEQLPVDASMPREYQLRQAVNRLQLIRPYGADEYSEASVERALAWLARSQASDGSWIAAMHGAGTETMALGEYRYGTGGRADTGISGLALLAFLSAGHTHQDGQYRDVVARGLGYLLDSQMPSGDLSGAKQVGNDPSVVYARMYCHSIAALALSEAYAMTRDPVLLPGVTKATRYSIKAQDVRGGGWRYRPGDTGDLSQFGWQAMALRSAQHSGIELSPDVQRRMRSFLDSCSAGEQGGLARYLPGEGRPSATMTAEALACRLLLDYPLSANAQAEAQRMLLQHLPGSEPDNVYYWYYATLALFQLQDDRWRTWNDALKHRLISTQLPDTQAQGGSWEPDSIWGGYGGRVYSTAVSCLCLEVYYRYLPMYQRSQLARQNASEINR